MATGEAEVLTVFRQEGIEELTKGLKSVTKASDAMTKMLERVEKVLDMINVSTSQTNVALTNTTRGFTTAEKDLAKSINDAANAKLKDYQLTQKVTEQNNKATESVKRYVKANREATGTTNTREAAQANRFNTGNIAAQAQDIIVTSAMNMNPLTIGLQQGTQLAYVLGQSKAPLADFVAGIKNLISPVSLLSVGLTALIAVIIQTVDWSKTAQSALNGLGDVFDWVGEHVLLVTSILAAGAVPLVAYGAELIKFGEKWVAFKKTMLALDIPKFMKSVGEAFVNCFNMILKHPIATLITVGTAAVVGFLAKTEKGKQVLNNLAQGFRDLGNSLTEVKEKGKDAGKWINQWSDSIAKGYEQIGDEKFKQSIEGLDTYTKTYKTTVHELATELLHLQKASNDEFKINDQVLKQAKDLAKAKAQQAVETEEYNRIREEAEAKQREEIERYNSVITYSSSLTKGFFSDMKSDLKEGESAWQAFTNSLLNMFDKISDKMMDLAIDAMFDSMKQGKNSSGSSWLNSAINAGISYFTGSSAGTDLAATESFAQNVGRKPTFNAAGGVYTNGVYNSPTMFTFANGGRFGVMGEAGPEAVMPLTRSSDGSLGVKAEGIGGGSPVVVNVINNSNARATTQQRQTEQGTTIDVMIDDLVAQKLGQTGTASNQALTAFNNRQLIAR